MEKKQKMRVNWVRGSDNISFNRPHTFFTLGVRGSGKSSLLQHIGELYLNEGHGILDLFGSRDGENMAWLRSPWAKTKKILLICGDNADVEAPCDVKPVSKVRLSDFNRYDILISSSPLYSSHDDEFLQVAQLTNLLYKRMSYRRLVYVIVREASSLYFSRLKLAKNQSLAKADMVYLIREARHMGVAMGLDTLKYTSIDIDIRAVTDYLIFKSQGILGFPRDLSWIYGFIEPRITRRMKPGNFIILSREGPLGVGVFPELPWHKQEKEHILNAVGVKVEFGDQLQYSEDKGSFKTVGDFEHSNIVKTYIEEKVGMGTLADALGRSSRTISVHIHKHNDAVESKGYCQICRRSQSPYAESPAIRI